MHIQAPPPFVLNQLQCVILKIFPLKKILMPG